MDIVTVSIALDRVRHTETKRIQHDARYSVCMAGLIIVELDAAFRNVQCILSLQEELERGQGNWGLIE